MVYSGCQVYGELNWMNNQELLALPFDQYQRYQLLKEIVGQIRQDDHPMTILDVGGYLQGGGQDKFVPIKEFMPHDNIIVADVKYNGPGNYIVASGNNLPIRDRSCHIVTALDTLEHIPPHRRKQFISELYRIADVALLIIGPVYTPENRLAEEILDEGIRYYINAKHPALQEHLEYGLPDKKDIAGWLNELDLKIYDFPDGFLPNWLFMMLMLHSLMQKNNSQDLIPKLNRFYNSTLGRSDRRAPAYRHAFVAGRKDLSLDVDSLIESNQEEISTGELHGHIMTTLMLLRESSSINKKVNDFHAIHQNYFEIVKLSEERLRLIHEKDEIIENQIEFLNQRDLINRELDAARIKNEEHVKQLQSKLSELDANRKIQGKELENLKNEYEKLDKSNRELISFRDKVVQNFFYKLLKKFGL